MWNLSKRKKRMISLVGLILVAALIVTSIITAAFVG